MGRVCCCLAVVISSGLLAETGFLSAGERASVYDDPFHPVSFSAKLETQIAEFDTVGLPMAELIIRLAYKYRTPMAFECTDADALRKPLYLKFKARSLREIIAGVVTSVPEFQVDFRQGIVDVYCPAARQDPSNPFNMIVPRYDVQGADTHMADAQLLCDISALHGGGCGGSVAGGQWGPLTITLHLANKRIYEILNDIVAQNGEALWVPIARVAQPSTISMNFWYIYPLDPTFETSVIKDLQAATQRRKPAAQ